MVDQTKRIFNSILKQFGEQRKDFPDEKKFNKELGSRTGLNNEKEFLQIINKIYNALRRPMPIPIEFIEELIQKEYGEFYGSLNEYKKMSAEQIRKSFWNDVKVDVYD